MSPQISMILQKKSKLIKLPGNKITYPEKHVKFKKNLFNMAASLQIQTKPDWFKYWSKKEPLRNYGQGLMGLRLHPPKLGYRCCRHKYTVHSVPKVDVHEERLKIAPLLAFSLKTLDSGNQHLLDLVIALYFSTYIIILNINVVFVYKIHYNYQMFYLDAVLSGQV